MTEPGNVLLDQTLESALSKHPEFPHHTHRVGLALDQVGVTSVPLPLGDSTEYGVQRTQLSIYCGRTADWTTEILNGQKTVLHIFLVVSQNHASGLPATPVTQADTHLRGRALRVAASAVPPWPGDRAFSVLAIVSHKPVSRTSVRSGEHWSQRRVWLSPPPW